MGVLETALVTELSLAEQPDLKLPRLGTTWLSPNCRF